MELKKFKNPTSEYAVDVRWWLSEGFHTDETLKHDLDMLKESGFGAIEFLAMDDPGADNALYGWGSEEWIHDSQLLFEESTKRGMGVSTTCSTNWSNCNLTCITPDDRAAAKELDYEIEMLKAGESRSGKIKQCVLKMPGVTKQDLVEVVALKDLGEKEDGKHYLDKDSAIVLTEKIVDGCLDFMAPEDGDYIVFYFWIHGTGQTAGPSASISYTVNYMDRDGVEAFKKYWDEEVLTPELKETLKENGRAMMYMDSLELSTTTKGGQLWGYTFMDEFRTRRGYNLAEYLPFIVKTGGMGSATFIYTYYMEDSVFAEKLYNDVYQTMTDMYMYNMMEPMKEWCNKNHMWLRSEISYGLPFEISQPGKFVDDVETESLEFASQIDSYRGLAGTAHVYNRLYSSETGATMMHYKLPLDFYSQIMYTQFAAGVTKTVLHGYSSIAGSEAATQWPGHEGMWPLFSERFGSRQPAYQHYNDWTAMMARYQMILRQGKPGMDLAMLRLDYNFNNLVMGEEMIYGADKLYTEKYMRNHEGFYWRDMQLQDAGYTWDYFAPQLLEENFVDFGDGVLMPDGPGYKGLVIYQDVLPLSSAEKILAMAKKGLPVLFVNGCTEMIRPGIFKTYTKAACMTPFNDGNDEKLVEVVAEIKALPNVSETDDQTQTIPVLGEMGILPRAAFAEPNQNVLTLSRMDGDKVIVYAYNMMYTETESFAFEMNVEGKGKPYRLWCSTGEVEEVGCYKTMENTTVLEITLAPGEACLYVIDTAAEEMHAIENDGCEISVENGVLMAKAFETGEFMVTLDDGTKKTVSVIVPESISLKEWELEVEDWNEGEKVEIIEDRGLGIVTKEVYYETTKEKLSAGTVELKPWKDIKEIGPEVSGVGYYKTRFTLPKDWDENSGAVLQIGSTNKNTAAVYVNGKKAPSFDVSSPVCDITALVHSGENEIVVEVSSTLTNRLISRHYYEQINEATMTLMRAANNMMETGDEEDSGEESMVGAMFGMDHTCVPQDYGMTGEVQIVFYKKAAL